MADFRFQNWLKVGVLAALIAGGIACTRGESKSVEEILRSASQRFSTSRTGQVLANGVSEKLDGVAERLSRLANSTSATSVKDLGQEIAQYLRELTPAAGYTTRPALNEIIDQYIAIAESQKLGSGDLSAGQAATVRLLAARTFFVLESELKGIRFGLLERESQPG